MFIIHGRRTARIKKYIDHHEACKNCQSFDLTVKIFREYYHFFYIPFFPFVGKRVEIRCNSCGEPIRTESLQKKYGDKVRPPFYLYSGIVLVLGLVLVGIFGNINTQQEKKRYIAAPLVGDVYLIRKEINRSLRFYFLRVIKVKGDTIWTCRNRFEYLRYVSEFSEKDYFNKSDELKYTKAELTLMLANDEINAVERNYGDSRGFNRVE